MKPNIFVSLYVTVKTIVAIPFYYVWVPNRKMRHPWTFGERVFMFFLCLLFWWVLIPVYTVQDYKESKKRYETEATK
jgi:hypothetical protein